MEIKGLLPIGSVVLLKNGQKRLMIFGVKQTDNDTGVEYDYIGVMYPEGNMGEAGQYLFNHSDIDQEFFRGYENDPAMYADDSEFQPYVYSDEAADRFFASKQRPGRVELAAVMDGRPIGQVQLKNIDTEKRVCELGVTMQNDAYKGKGYGTQIIRLALKLAVDRLGMEAIYADTVLRNTRSQHVMEKTGFRYVREDGKFKYYRWEK